MDLFLNLAIMVFSGVIVYFLWKLFKRAKRRAKLTTRKNWQLKQIFFWLLIAQIVIFVFATFLLMC